MYLEADDGALRIFEEASLLPMPSKTNWLQLSAKNFGRWALMMAWRGLQML
jgi:hypothetical protein